MPEPRHGERVPRTPRGRRAPQQNVPTLAIGVGVAALLVATLVVLALQPQSDDGAGTVTPVDTFSHVHGLAVDPERPHRLLVATHHGLIRSTDNGSWERVGPVQDYMGFTLHPADGDTMWASGHPAEGGNLGVLRSTNAGLSWSALALPNVDFHAMTVSPAAPERMWGSYAGRLYASADAGASWRIVETQAPPLLALAAHPREADTLFASTSDRVMRSADAGATWETRATLAAYSITAHPTDADALLAATPEGVQRSDDAGAAWHVLAGARADDPPVHVAVDPSAPNTMYVATARAAIHRSGDDGATWTTLHEP